MRNDQQWALICSGIALLGSPCIVGAAELRFDQAVEQVAQCRIDIQKYAYLWTRDDAMLINLPNSGAINGIVISQFYLAPGRGGGTGDYGVVFNAPFAQIQSAFPEYDGMSVVNGYKRQLVPLARETGNPRNKGQTLLVCRGPVAL